MRPCSASRPAWREPGARRGQILGQHAGKRPSASPAARNAVGPIRHKVFGAFGRPEGAVEETGMDQGGSVASVAVDVPQNPKTPKPH